MHRPELDSLLVLLSLNNSVDENSGRVNLIRIELAHLTVSQYRQAAADLIGSFRTPGRLDDRRGLQGDYGA